LRGQSRTDARHRAYALLGEFGLSRLAAMEAGRLSGGEQRRLEVARAVATAPRFLLSDEPFAGIDPMTIEMLHDLFVKLRAGGMGILLTDHNVKEALALCDRAYVLLAGRVLAHGTPAELSANALVRRHFLGDAGSEDHRPEPRSAPAGGGASDARGLALPGGGTDRTALRREARLGA
jgi:lipopolysaccharide export system ATP-binding protein